MRLKALFLVSAIAASAMPAFAQDYGSACRQAQSDNQVGGMILGGILGGATPELEQALARYGMHLGTAFQLVDDVLDYSGKEAATGKHLGDDLAEGKPTLPLIHVMQRGTPEQAACVRKAIEEGFKERNKFMEDSEFTALRELPEFQQLLTMEVRVL